MLHKNMVNLQGSGGNDGTDFLLVCRTSKEEKYEV